MPAHETKTAVADAPVEQHAPTPSPVAPTQPTPEASNVGHDAPTQTHGPADWRALMPWMDDTPATHVPVPTTAPSADPARARREALADVQARGYAAQLALVRGNTDSKQGRWAFLNTLDKVDDPLVREKMKASYQSLTGESLEGFIEHADWAGGRDKEQALAMLSSGRDQAEKNIASMSPAAQAELKAKANDWAQGVLAVTRTDDADHDSTAVDIFRTLGPRSPEEIEAIRGAIRENTHGQHSIYEELDRSLSGGTEDEAVAGLSGNPVHAAIAGISNTDNNPERVKEILRGLTSAQREQLLESSRLGTSWITGKAPEGADRKEIADLLHGDLAAANGDHLGNLLKDPDDGATLENKFATVDWSDQTKKFRHDRQPANVLREFESKSPEELMAAKQAWDATASARGERSWDAMIVERFGDGDRNTLLRLQALSSGDRSESRAIGLRDAFEHHNQGEIERILASPDLKSTDPAKRTAAQLERQQLGAKMQAWDRARQLAVAFGSNETFDPSTQGRALDTQLVDYYAEEAKANPFAKVDPSKILDKGVDRIVQEHADGVRDNRVAATELLEDGELSKATEIYRDEKAGHTDKKLATLEGQRTSADVTEIGNDYEAKYGKPMLKRDDGGRFEYMARLRQSGGDTRPIEEICRDIAREDMNANQLRVDNLLEYGTKPERRPQLEVELQRQLYQKQHSDSLDSMEAQRAYFGGNLGTEDLARSQLATADDMLEPAKDPFGIAPRDLKAGVERSHFDQIDKNLTNTLDVQREEKLKLAESTGKIFSTIAMVGALLIGQPELIFLFDAAANLAKMRLKSNIAGEAYDASADMSEMGTNLLMDAGLVGFSKVVELAHGARAVEGAMQVGEDAAKAGEGAASQAFEHAATVEEQASSIEAHLEEAIEQPALPKEQPRRIAEVFTGPNLDSAHELAARNPGAQIVAAEGSHLPSAEEIANFEQEGHQFIPDSFGESIPTGSLDEMHARYPLPHAKAMEGIGAQYEPELRRVLAENPGMSRMEAMVETTRRIEGRIESVQNLGPHALDKLKADGTLDLTFWEAREIMPEVENLTGRVQIDPITGERFQFVVETPAELVPRASVGAQGWGVPPDVSEVTHIVLRKVPVP